MCLTEPSKWMTRTAILNHGSISMEQRLLTLWTKPKTLISGQRVVVQSYALLHTKNPNKKGGKTPANSGKGKGQRPKSARCSTCETCRWGWDSIQQKKVALLRLINALPSKHTHCEESQTQHNVFSASGIDHQPCTKRHPSSQSAQVPTELMGIPSIQVASLLGKNVVELSNQDCLTDWSAFDSWTS